MIVSFRRRFIFVAIPKTATQTFRVALRPHLGEGDWEQCVLFERKFFPIKPLADIGHGHLMCRDVQPFLLPELWNTFFRFCTVRNPYDRYISYCCFMNRENQRMQTQPLETMKRMIEGKNVGKETLLRPQGDFITDEHGRLMVNYICRLESLQADFDHISSKLQFPRTQLPRANVSNTGRYRALYDRELQQTIQSVYREDFTLLDYSLELDGHVDADRPAFT